MTVSEHSDFSTLGAYLTQILGVQPKIEPFDETYIPFYLRNRYVFSRAEFSGFPCVLFSPRSEQTDWTPKSIEIDAARLFDLQGAVAVFVCEGLGPVQRRRLLLQHQPFIDPGYQLYIPDLAINLREHFKAKRRLSEFLSPSAQHMLLYALQLPLAIVYDGGQMAHMLKTSRMTVSRAFTELENFGLAESRMIGRTRQFLFRRDRRAVWEQAQQHLRSPIKRSFDLYECPTELLEPASISGISALAEYTNLNPEKQSTWAVSNDHYLENVVAFEGLEAPNSGWGDTALEVWKYPPVFSHDDDIAHRIRKRTGSSPVDRLSLYLCLRDSDDERVLQALETLIDEAPWSEE